MANFDDNFYHVPISQVAVVMVDFQNDFCGPNLYNNAANNNTHNASAAKKANKFASRAAELGAQVVYSKQILDFDKLDAKQKRWESPDGMCVKGTAGAELFIEPIPGSSVVTKYRYDIWQSAEFTGYLAAHDIDAVVICGDELSHCVLYAMLGAAERGFHYLVAEDLVSGSDKADDTYNLAVRDFMRYTHPRRYVKSEDILENWQHSV